jgi:4-hydroxyacetophenone monooxygenase
MTNAQKLALQFGSFDAEDLRRILDQADCNILRMALYQQTGDPALAAMTVEKQALRGGVFSRTVLAQKHHDEVKQKALALLMRGPLPPVQPASRNESRRLLELFGGTPLSDEEFDLGVEELAVDPFPREARWNVRPPQAVIDGYRVLIVGAGMSGIMAGIQLGRLGIPYTIVERQSGPGGVWETNDYPEARVDISSFLYQFKFVKNYPWPEYFATRDNNLAYLKEVADRYDVLQHMIFDTEVIAAEWNEAEAHWKVTLRSRDGSVSEREVPLLISASGLFSTPRIPNIEGIDTFSGTVFHSTAWDHSCSLRGKRVALVGNGSTGTQMLRHIAEEAASVAVYQRTPQWIAPSDNYREKVAPETRWLLDNIPGYWNWYCYSAHLESLPFQDLQYYDPEWQKAGGKISEKNDKFREVLTSYIHAKVKGDPELIAKCVPDYAPASRRLVVDNGWYDALTRPHVELVTDGIDHITPGSITAKNGVERPADVIILAAGFEVARYFWPAQYVGRDGLALGDAWKKDGPRAYLGMTMPSFPNLFVFYGPNSQNRIGGFYSWVEIWSRYIGELIVALIERRARSIECRQDVCDAYNLQLDAQMERLTWSQEGRGGYHVRDFGRSVMHAPWSVENYHSRVKSANLADFSIEPAKER